MPDFTKGDSIPAAAKHDWNLGATGARGWMFCDKLVTTDARQIAITKVETGSPADGILAVGDVLLGVGVKPLFADSIRVEGLQLLAKHRIAEGISACVKYTRDQNPWDSQERTPKLMKILLTYGTHAKSVIPELTRIADYFEKDEKDFPKIYLG